MFKKFICLTSFVLLISLVLTNETNAVIDSSLVCWWSLNENSGTTATDASGNNNDGTLYGGASWTSGMYGGGVYLDGEDDYIEMPIPLTEAGTIGFWFKPDWDGSDPDSYVIFDASTATIYFCISKGSNNADMGPEDFGFYFEEGAADADFQNVEIDAGTISADVWFHVAITWDWDASSVYFYIDGEEVADQANIGDFPDLFENPRFGMEATPYLGFSHGAQGVIDEILIYNRALTADEVRGLLEMSGATGAATSPNPIDGDTDVLREVILSWKPGKYPGTHTIYFGSDFNDVNDGAASTLISERQDATTFDIGRLEFGTTYYWRVDEVNDSADATVYKGNIWSFTTEPLAIKIPSSNITATASSQSGEANGPENTINELGLDPNNMDLHTRLIEHMWSTDPAEFGQPAWIQYDFDKLYKLHQMLVWNFNGEIILAGFGAKDVNIVYTEDGQEWTKLEGADQLAKAPGTPGYEYNTTVEFNGVAAKAVRINILNNWGGGFYNQLGLSEVRFMSIPVHAREPDPDIDEDEVPIDVTLSWRDGREAQQHTVSLSTDQQVVSEGNAVITTVDEASYGPLSLNIASDYYWRIDEVNDNETPTTWVGDTWSFRTQEYLVVDDFEHYTDEEPNRVWDIWSDGWDPDDNNGSTMGYPDPDFEAGEHFVEIEIVRSGEQSAPIFYDNTSDDYSEVSVDTTDLPIGTTDWTVGSPEAFVLWFYGDPNNEPDTDQIYVKLGNTKKVYPGDIADISRTAWTKFEVPLAGMNFSNISSLTIGIEKTGATGGDGVLFVDDIQLTYFVTAVDPGTDNLIAKYDMENNVLDSSGSGFDGIFYGGDPNYQPGKYGMALVLDGNDDYVELPIGETISTLTNCTISSRVNWSGGNAWQRVFDFGTSTSNYLFMTVSNNNEIRAALLVTGQEGEDLASSAPPLSPDNWEHMAVVVDADNSILKLYLNGNLVGTDDTLRYSPADMGVTTQNWLGRSQWPDPYLNGALDDFRIYDRALSESEIKYIYEN